MTNNDDRVSLRRDERRRFLMILTLLSALSADVLDTGKQQNMEYSIVKFGKPDNWSST